MVLALRAAWISAIRPWVLPPPKLVSSLKTEETAPGVGEEPDGIDVVGLPGPVHDGPQPGGEVRIRHRTGQHVLTRHAEVVDRWRGHLLLSPISAVFGRTTTSCILPTRSSRSAASLSLRLAGRAFEPDKQQRTFLSLSAVPKWCRSWCCCVSFAIRFPILSLACAARAPTRLA
jgi:hypothetical protein